LVPKSERHIHRDISGVAGRHMLGAAAHGDRFRFALAQIARGQRAVVLLAFSGVA